MEMKQINKVSIALKPNVYSTFRNLNNTVSNTLGEYVDNAVQSFLNHKTELFDLMPESPISHTCHTFRNNNFRHKAA